MMEEVDLDCRGLKCPEPVMRTKKALQTAGGSFTVLVDNQAARDNVSRFARTAGCEVKVSDAQGGFLLELIPGAVKPEEMPRSGEMRCDAETVTVFFISSDEIGTGDRELGTTLMKAFLYASSESEDVPDRAVFMNSGVRLVTENDETVAHMKRLEERGVELLVCGTCLEYYGLADELRVGRVSNMYEIQSALVGADRLVSI